MAKAGKVDDGGAENMLEGCEAKMRQFLRVVHERLKYG
jgi:hypothetical protein